MLGDVKKIFFCFQKFVDHAQLKPTFPPTIWIFTEDEGDEIKFRLPFNIFSTLQSQYILALNKVWFLFLFFSAGISTSFADWPRFCYKNTSSLRWKSKHSIELKTEAWKPETEQNFFSRYTTYITIYSAYMILRSIWTVFKNAILHTNEVSKISPATKSLFCSDLLLVFVETY